MSRRKNQVVETIQGYWKKQHELEAQNKQLIETSNELLTAMEQHQFFMVGYKNGSASISEVMEASQKEHEAYSKLWNLTKSL